MEKTSVQKLARVLRVLVTVTFVCNLLVLPLVPGLVGIGREGTRVLLDAALTGRESENLIPIFFAACWQYLFRVWREGYTAVLTAFLLICGANTAAVLWQARRVLGTVVAGNPFQEANGKSMKRAAVCCFLISAAALARAVWRVWYYRSLTSLGSYNTLFVPLFAMGGLLCMVMSALFRQAYELKAENDLTI